MNLDSGTSHGASVGGSEEVGPLKPIISVPCLKPPRGRTLVPDPWGILMSNQKMFVDQCLFRFRNGSKNRLYPLKPNFSSNNSYLLLKAKGVFKNGFLVLY